MISYIVGALTMLIGVVIGYALSNSNKEETEEIARWTQPIDKGNIDLKL